MNKLLKIEAPKSLLNEEGIEIKVGQIWENCDPRRRGHYFVIKSINGVSASCQNIRTGTIRNIQIGRLAPGPSGYSLVLDLGIVAEVVNRILGLDNKHPISSVQPVDKAALKMMA